MSPLDLFHPAVAAWFREAFPLGPTEAQRRAWPRIAAGEDVLLVSPTGTGKTLAAFLVALDGVLVRKLAGDVAPRLSVLYVSPLKALGNDIARNLERPRAGIRAALAARGVDPASVPIEAAVRTGDTPTSARTAQARRPPDVLITTPESLYLMLTGTARKALSSVRTVLLDEVHSVAGTKRGVHLAVSLERLAELVARAGGPPPQRVALSATVAPVETVAAFAAGSGRRMSAVVVPAKKALDLAVTSPAADFRQLPDGSAWGPALEAIAAEVGKRTTTLVFCNNRRLAERIAARLEERLLSPVPVHHGSVARQERESVERRLKGGELRVLVATGSLELGIDVGHVDAVVLVESPKGVARGLQRVGRSGHLVGETARGLLVPLFSEDLLECAATAEGMREGAVEETRPPEGALDVLAQQLVAEVAARDAEGGAVTAGELYALVRRAEPYHRLTRRLFEETLAMLSGKYPKERFAELAAKLVWDRATGRVSPLPAARLAALLDGGTIPDRGTFAAVTRDGRARVGELDEEFVYETRKGDVFLLGSRAWRAVEISGSEVVVEDATGQPARMPFWRGEGLGRTAALGERIGRLKREVAGRLDDPGLSAFLAERYAVTQDAAAAIAGSVRREVAESGGLASDEAVVFETFPNELGDPCLVVRSVFGRGVNLPWSLVLSSVVREETGVDVESVASDDGFLLRLPRAERELPLERLSRLGSAEAKERLLAILPDSPMFGARFRENAQRALLLPRRRGGRRTPFWLQRLKARDLLQTTRSLPDFPIVAETYRDCLRDLWEAERLLGLLDRLAEGTLGRVVVSRRTPSPAAASLLFRFVAVYMYEWDAPKAEREVHALAANRSLLGEVLGGRFDDGLRPEAAEEARAEASRLVAHRTARSAEELLAVLLELGDLSDDEARERSRGDGAAWLDELSRRGSVVRAAFPGGGRWVAAEERGRFDLLLSGRADDALLDELLLRLLATRGPVTAADLAGRYGLASDVVGASLERLRLEGRAVPGRLGAPEGVERWASARLAESIRRKTLAILRREIRPVGVETFRSALCRRQGVEDGARFSGPHAAERAVSLLRGLALPALSWETSLLPARLAEPEPDALDVLSARGLLVWRALGQKDPRAARLQFFLRGEGRLVLPHAPPDLSALSPEARSLHEALALSGASFLPDLLAHLRLPAPALEKALVELVLAGLVTGDGMHGLRDLLRGARRPARAEAGPSLPVRSPAFGRPPGRSSRRAAEARVAARIGFSRAAGRDASLASGRFSLLSSPGVAGPEPEPGEREEAWARLLLARWGVVFRDLVEAEETAVRWSEVAPVLSRMELRGDARRGEFVAGAGPLQYALPETVEELRARREPSPPSEAPFLSVVGGADPVLWGLSPPPERDEWVALAAGRPVFRLSPDGTLSLDDPSSPDRLLRAALARTLELLRRSRDPLGRPRRVKVEHLAPGRPVAGTAVALLLEEAGFVRDGAGYSFRAL